MRSARWLAAVAVAACTSSSPGADMMDAAATHAIDFVRALSAREYERAHGMTSSEYQGSVSVSEMRAAFEEIVPDDWGDTEPVELGMSMADWPTKREGDAGWVFVSIYGDVYSEGVTVVVALEGDALKVRDVEWGRP